MLRNILGPIFNLYLDRILTYKICYFFCFVFFWGGGGWNPYFYSVFSKKAKNKETQKRKKTLFVNTIVLTALVKMSVFFFLQFSFLLFLQFPLFPEMLLTSFPKLKYNKIAKQEKQNNNNNNNNKNNKKTRCKAKRNPTWWLKTNKTTSRKTNKTEKQNNILKQRSKQNKR